MPHYEVQLPPLLFSVHVRVHHPISSASLVAQDL
jgi:hypothetical protein